MDTYEIEGNEVIEREVTKTGNGAHVYVPKDWLEDMVKVVRISPDEATECDICRRKGTDTEEWVWLDESGGMFFQICTDCRSEVEKGPEGACAICQENREVSKSDGFGPMGSAAEYFRGCDTCRKRVLYGNVPAPQPEWIE